MVTFDPKLSVAEEKDYPPELIVDRRLLSNADEKSQPDFDDKPNEKVPPCNREVVSKRIYSKNDFGLFRSLKSVMKPRMIHMIKDARD